jgi:hypothetical protein
VMLSTTQLYYSAGSKPPSKAPKPSAIANES